jgi:hypothetical protein
MLLHSVVSIKSQYRARPLAHTLQSPQEQASMRFSNIERCIPQLGVSFLFVLE